MDDVFVMLPYIAINSIITEAYHQHRDDKKTTKANVEDVLHMFIVKR